MFYTFEEQKDARYLLSVFLNDVQRANSCCDMILESMKNVPKYIPHYTKVKNL